jgi:hypothetical protein
MACTLYFAVKAGVTLGGDFFSEQVQITHFYPNNSLNKSISYWFFVNPGFTLNCNSFHGWMFSI